ncbi:MAG TPA: single-stranded-DNA-specific exonuclease RecJ [Epsilonproteobacteria bacterium]|nr:single-stranded-DNA-specific exonuclease RecJ [Campylobacterota bacterium]
MMLPLIDFEILDEILSKRFENIDFKLQDLPSYEHFKDMQKSSLRIKQAILEKQNIFLVGDYDVDGVISTTLMILFFETIKYDKFKWIIPNRFTHGYGLSMALVDKLHGADLIITVDNGIGAFEVAKWCNDNSIDLIITDHHTPAKNLPDAYAIINPKQNDCNFPFAEICGAQVAWYLIASLKNILGVSVDLKSLLGLVSLAIVADIMPLVGINRAMVIAGLRELLKDQSKAIELLREHRLNFTSEDIAFWIAPLLNSAGRIADATKAVEFLRSQTLQEAREKFENLVSYNTLRKTIEQETTKEALKSIANPDDSILVCVGKDWHEGVLGIVAARVAEQLKKPVIVLTTLNDKLLKGSGRSYGDCDLHKSLVEVSSCLKTFGGHRAAIGLSLEREKLVFFTKKLKYSFVKCDDYKPIQKIVGLLPFESINSSLIEVIKRYEPYGEGNLTPTFKIKNIQIVHARELGGGEHIRYLLKQGDIQYEAIHFRAKEKFKVNQEVDLTCQIKENNFRGVTKLQLLIENIYITNS